MNKRGMGIAAAVAVLLAAGAGTSYVMGGKIQEGFESTSQSWSKPPLKIEVQSYERGLFSSTAKTLWTVNMGEEQVRFTAEHAIKHGPWPRGHAAEVATRFVVNADAPPELVSLYKDKVPLEWNTQIAWSKKSQHQLSSPAVAGQFEKDKLNFAGLTADFEMTADFKGMKGTAKMPSFQVESTVASAADLDTDAGETATNVVMKDNAMRFDLFQPEGQEFMLGSVNWTLGSLEALPKFGGDATQISGLSLEMDSRQQGEVVNTRFNTAIKQLGLPTQKVSDVAFDVNLLNLDAAWLNQFTKGSQDVQNDPKALQALLMGGMQQLLARKPELEFKRISWRTDEGVSELSASVSYQGDAAKGINPATDIKAQAQLNMPKAMLQALLASKARSRYLESMEGSQQAIDVKELTEMVNQDAGERINALVESGILVPQDKAVTMKLDYTNGQAQANGKPLDGSGMMGLMAAMP